MRRQRRPARTAVVLRKMRRFEKLHGLQRLR
jgi:hypothetical protein